MTIAPLWPEAILLCHENKSGTPVEGWFVATTWSRLRYVWWVVACLLSCFVGWKIGWIVACAGGLVIGWVVTWLDSWLFNWSLGGGGYLVGKLDGWQMPHSMRYSGGDYRMFSDILSNTRNDKPQQEYAKTTVRPKHQCFTHCFVRRRRLPDEEQPPLYDL